MNGTHFKGRLMHPPAYTYSPAQHLDWLFLTSRMFPSTQRLVCLHLPRACLAIKRRLGTVQKHLLKGPMQKKWPLKFLTIVRGPWKKIPQIFQFKLSLHGFLWGRPIIFMAKKEGWFFSGLTGAPQNLCEDFYCIRYPTRVCKRSLTFFVE